MPTIYVSYRSDDRSPTFTALIAALDARFGTAGVLIDVAVGAGMDYAAALDSAISRADSMLVVVGPQWLTATDEAGRRKIDRTYDVVHYEIALALQRHIPVTVLRIDGATPLAAEALPADISALSQEPDFLFMTTTDLGQISSIAVAANQAMGLETLRAKSPLGLPIAILAGIVAILTLSSGAFSVLFVWGPYVLLAGLIMIHVFFLIAWILGIAVAVWQRRWIWLAAITALPLVFLLWTIVIYIQVVQSHSPGAGEFLLFPLFISYVVEGWSALPLIAFGLFTAKTPAFLWR